MNRSRARELLPIIQAYADGKDIQFRHNEEKGEWLDLPELEHLIFTFPAIDYEYRIKPEPREFYLMKISNSSFTAYTKDQLGPNPEEDDTFIKVREVLDDGE